MLCRISLQKTITKSVTDPGSFSDFYFECSNISLKENKRDGVDLNSNSLDYCTRKSEGNRKNDLILIMTPEKQDKTLELSKHWSVDSTPARNEVTMKRTYPVKSVKCDKICSNY